MKVAYFIGALSRGGAETLMLDMCRKHRDVPYDFVCVYRHDGNMSEAFKASGAPMIQIPKKRGYLRYLWDIRKAILHEHVTIVHSQTPSNTLLLAFALLGTEIKIVTTFHGHMFADDSWWKRKIVYAASEKIICVSEYQKRYYEQKWRLPKENKLRVVYNGIDFSKFEVTNERVNELTNEGRARLCMVGNFIKGRSQMVVCEALRELSVNCKVEGVKWDFYFIGRKDEEQAWRYEECVKYCEENQLSNALFLGGREDVPELLKTMDGFVYSTEHDTFGIAVIEAIAAGVPVVVNDWDVMMEITNNGEWATIYPTGNVEQLANEMEKLITHPAEYKEKCMVYAEKVRERFSIEKHIERLSAIYDEIDHRRMKIEDIAI
jgi:glycosyltransferase involved in cell wall biosynthesis